MLTETVDTPGRRGGDQIKEMDLKLHPDLKGPLTILGSDPNTTIVVLSGSGRSVLDDVRHLLSSLAPFFLLSMPYEIIGFCRILGSMTSGWQLRMGCFYDLQKENGG